MNDASIPEPTRFSAIMTHLSLVGMSFLLSIVAMQGIGLVPGEVISFACGCYLVLHGFAALLALCLRRVTTASCLVVFGIGFFPTALHFVGEIHKAYKERYVLPGDRFRDHLAPTVPASVRNLRFVPLRESIRPDLMFRFDIAPAELDEILARLKFVRIAEPHEFRRHDDLFKNLSYLPLEGDDEIYQVFDKWNQLLILKTNRAHTRVIFRRG